MIHIHDVIYIPVTLLFDFLGILFLTEMWRVTVPNVNSIFESGNKKVGKKNNKVFFWIVVIGVLLLGSVLFIALMPQKKGSTYVLKTYSKAIVSPKTIRNIISSTGVVELRLKETILSPENSQVSAVFVSEGDSVSKGQAIAQLVTTDLEWNLVMSKANYEQALRDAQMNDTEYEFSIRQKEISIKTAKRNVENAQENLVQIQGLFDRNIAASSELANAKNAVADSIDSLDLAQLTLEQTIAKQTLILNNRTTELAKLKKEMQDIEEAIASCTIRSGITGQVYSISVDVGDRIGSYATVAVLANPLDIQLGIDVAENRVAEIKTGNPVSVTIGNSVFPAVVSSIASSATTSSSSASSTVRVVATFEHVPSTAIVGGSVSAEIQVGLIENALTLPRGPFLSSGNYTLVYVITDSHSAVKRTVQFGITDGTTIEVISGLDAGDRVITSAYQDYIHVSEIELSK